MQAAHADIADVHGGTFADRFEAFEDLDVGGAVLLLFEGLGHEGGIEKEWISGGRTRVRTILPKYEISRPKSTEDGVN
jgi:hypothetical protein